MFKSTTLLYNVIYNVVVSYSKIGYGSISISIMKLDGQFHDANPISLQATILENTHLFSGSTQKDGICEVLYAAAWITGEFSEFLPDPRGAIDALLNPKITALPGHIQAVFVQNIVKLYASILVKAEAEVCIVCVLVCMTTCIYSTCTERCRRKEERSEQGEMYVYVHVHVGIGF